MMHGKGLTKLIEECGELSQIAAKKLAYLNTDIHPDGKGSLQNRLEEEIADVMAACQFVMLKLNLDSMKIATRINMKTSRYTGWDR